MNAGLKWNAMIGVLLAAAACAGRDARQTGDDTSGTPAAASGSPAPAATDTGGMVAGATRTVLFVGTSLTAGLGLDPEEAYPAIIGAKIDSAGLPYTVVNAGVSGETSAGALRRIDWLLRGPVDVLVLETGANDGLRALPVDSTRANIRAILDRVKSARPAARLALVQMEAPPNLGAEYTSSFRAMFPAVARETGATLIPFLLEGVAGEAGLNQSDGIHPNVRGERIVAENVWRALGPLLGERLDPPLSDR
jgi:acyl-CoA thioesterase-1